MGAKSVLYRPSFGSISPSMAQFCLIMSQFLGILIQSCAIITRSNIVIKTSIITGTEIEYQSDTGSTKDTLYLTLTGELWGVFCEYLSENWSRYNGTTLYMSSSTMTHQVCNSALYIHKPVIWCVSQTVTFCMITITNSYILITPFFGIMTPE